LLKSLELTAMAIELSKEDRAQAIDSLTRYVLENLDQKIGNLTAAAMLGFILEDIGPSIYNRAVSDVKERLLMRVEDVDFEIHEDEFQYWRKFEKRK
jgi:uncharacterized protein (DUF2164 family)